MVTVQPQIWISSLSVSDQYFFFYSNTTTPHIFQLSETFSSALFNRNIMQATYAIYVFLVATLRSIKEIVKINFNIFNLTQEIQNIIMLSL